MNCVCTIHSNHNTLRIAVMYNLCVHICQRQLRLDVVYTYTSYVSWFLLYIQFSRGSDCVDCVDCYVVSHDDCIVVALRDCAYMTPT